MTWRPTHPTSFPRSKNLTQYILCISFFPRDALSPWLPSNHPFMMLEKILHRARHHLLHSLVGGGGYQAWVPQGFVLGPTLLWYTLMLHKQVLSLPCTGLLRRIRGTRLRTPPPSVSTGFFVPLGNTGWRAALQRQLFNTQLDVLKKIYILYSTINQY